jgi:tetratricopeptide (TPR) repeat protein
MARAYLDQYRAQEALFFIEKAIISDCTNAEFYMQRAQIHQVMGNVDKARADFEQASLMAPCNVNVLNAQAYFWAECGDFDKSRQCYERSMQIDSQKIETYFHYVNFTKNKHDNAVFTFLLKTSQRSETLSEQEKIYLHFALGKCYEDVGEYDIAFEHYNKGNLLKHQHTRYDSVADAHRLQVLIKAFSAQKIHDLKVSQASSIIPIFVVGMPRSGTTLVEQIIASHSLVYGAGELYNFAQAIMSLGKCTGSSYPDCLQDINKDDVINIADHYIKSLQILPTNLTYIVDKMPGNFLFLGLIYAAFPNAKIIHVKRNALDTCVSNFTRLYMRGQLHSYDLSELGNDYRNYELLMAHWKNVLPKSSFLEVQYEKLVTDIEYHARRLIDYCELSWENQCLTYYENKRTVQTISVAQVRQPAYTTSINRWRHYNKFLGPLRTALGEYNSDIL